MIGLAPLTTERSLTDDLTAALTRRDEQRRKRAAARKAWFEEGGK